MTINLAEFRLWQSLDVTKKFYRIIEVFDEEAKEEILNINCMSPNANVLLAKLSGLREGLDVILNLSIEEIENEESESSGL